MKDIKSECENLISQFCYFLEAVVKDGLQKKKKLLAIEICRVQLTLFHTDN
jgi:hypothetical protein